MPGSMRGEKGRQLKARLARRDGARCFYCRTPFPDPCAATFDHYVPWCLWPVNRFPNLVLACAGCNERKGSALPWAFVWLLLAATRPDDLVRAA
jgi:5-methylcytosine-specific restriction endonuclease McrA